MRVARWLVSLVLAVGCAMPRPPVVTPALRPVAIRTCVPGAEVRVADAGTTMVADGNGDVSTNVPDTFNLHARAAGYPPYDRVIAFDRPGGKQILLGSCVPLTDPDLQIVLPSWGPLYADTGERGTVVARGDRFLREDGSLFAWRGTDGFLLYQNWLTQKTGIDPVVQNWLTCGGLCSARGPNVVRVLGMVSWGPLVVQDHPDYYTELGPFVDHLWVTFHLRVEFVIFADAQILMPDYLEEMQHAQRVLAQLAGKPNVFIEVANEPFKNIPGDAATAYRIGQQLQGHGLSVASGDYDDVTHTRLDYTTVHTDRGPEWPRKVKDLIDIPGILPPVVGDEPIGASETDKPSRSTNADDFAQFAAACQMFAAGCTFHSDAGTLYALYGPVQARAAQGFFTGLHAVSPEAQFAGYERGSDNPGCNWVPGNSLVEHDDIRELRSFGKAVGPTAYAVQIRTNRDHPTPCGVWKVIDEPWRGLSKLVIQ